MIEYNGNKYKSKSDIIRDMFDKGFLTIDSKSKKQLANELQISLSNVHNVLSQYINKQKNNIKVDKINLQPVSNKGMIFITDAPNAWGLPVTNPPISISKNYPKIQKESSLDLFGLE